MINLKWSQVLTYENVSRDIIVSGSQYRIITERRRKKCYQHAYCQIFLSVSLEASNVNGIHVEESDLYTVLQLEL